MTQFIRAFFTTFFLVSVVQGWLVKTKNWPVKAVGKVTCYGKPMPHVVVRLKDKDLLIDKTMGSTRTNANGYFIVSGSGRDGFRGKPDPYIRVDYSYSGAYGKMKVVGFLKIVRKAKTGVKHYNSYINFGNINFNSQHCKAYVSFYKALKEFRSRTSYSLSLPYSTLYVRTNAILHGGTPYATTNVIRIPKNYPISESVANHEFAHTIRHSYDGGLAHFLRDVIRFKYTQRHHCSKKTNHGFAFNEGWAEYWAKDCLYGYYGKTNNYSIEGNVAKALTALQKKCSSSYYKMVNVLRRNKWSIHSFASFNQKHYNLYKCKL